MRIFQEEIFGPVVAVTEFNGYDDAIRIANDTLYGLGAGVWSRDGSTAYRAGRDIKAGRVWTNCYHLYPADAAFGGYKQSGIGRENHAHDARPLPADEEPPGELLTRSRWASSKPPPHPDRCDLAALCRQSTVPRGVRRGTCRPGRGDPDASALLAKLRAEHGPLMLHQSGGCCDGSSPMCYPPGIHARRRDVFLGVIADDVPVYIGAAQFAYWSHTHLTIDVVKGRGGGFSLEAPEGFRFLTRSRLFTDAEAELLEAAGPPARGEWVPA